LYAAASAASTGTTATFIISSTASSTSTNTGALQVIGGVGVGGNVNIGGSVTGGGIRTSSTSTAPTNPTVGDIWYNTSTDDIYRYTSDGTTSVWLDITGPTGANNSVSSSSQPVFHAWATAGQSLPATTFSLLAFQNKIHDNTNAFNVTAATVTLNGLSVPAYSFMPTVAGYYQVNYSVRQSGTAEVVVALFKNATVFAIASDVTSNDISSAGSSLVYLNGSTDYISAYAYSAAAVTVASRTSTISGQTVGYDTYFSGTYVGTGIGYVSGTNTYNGVAQIQSAAPLTAPLIKDSAGKEIGQFAKAWVKFDGTIASPTISGSFNVSSVTKQSTGNFTITFTNALPNANYVMTGNTGFGNTVVAISATAAANCQIQTYNAAGAALRDAITYVAFFG